MLFSPLDLQLSPSKSLGVCHLWCAFFPVWSALIGTCLDGVRPKDASNDMPSFGGDYVEIQQFMIRIW
jgi:hypothetical protein